MLKKISESIPLLTILLLTLSIIKQILFFWNYGVQINYFLGLSELGLLVSDELIFSLPVLILFSYFNYFYAGLKRENKPDPPVKTQKIIRWVISVFFIILISIVIFDYFQAKLYPDKLISFSFILVCSFFLYITIIGNDVYLHFPTRAKFYSSTIFITVLVYIIGETGYTLKMVDKGRYTGTKIITNDSTYISDSNSYFIGKTNSFIFIYNKSNSTTNIIPVESVKRIILKRNN